MKKILALLITVSSVCALDNFAYPKQSEINAEAANLAETFNSVTGYNLQNNSSEYSQLWVFAAKKVHRDIIRKEIANIQNEIGILETSLDPNVLVEEQLSQLQDRLSKAQSALKQLK